MRYKTQSGFTMLEVIVVLLIIGIIAVVAISRFVPINASLDAQEQMLKANLRFAQLKSLHDDTTTFGWGLIISNTSYTLHRDGASATISLPAGMSNTHTLGSGITITTPMTVTFDRFGSPGTSPITITMTDGSQTKQITITANTGFIP